VPEQDVQPPVGHWHEPLQVRAWQVLLHPLLSLVPAAHTPWLMQLMKFHWQFPPHWYELVPQLPQVPSVLVWFGEQTPWLMHAGLPHWHDPLHVYWFVPHSPQDPSFLIWFGEQTPCPEHPVRIHWHEPLHV
jgi:hypothetical protein